VRRVDDRGLRGVAPRLNNGERPPTMRTVKRLWGHAAAFNIEMKREIRVHSNGSLRWSTSWKMLCDRISDVIATAGVRYAEIVHDEWSTTCIKNGRFQRRAPAKHETFRSLSTHFCGRIKPVASRSFCPFSKAGKALKTAFIATQECQRDSGHVSLSSRPGLRPTLRRALAAARCKRHLGKASPRSSVLARGKVSRLMACSGPSVSVYM
jgi:hypothetical protein